MQENKIKKNRIIHSSFLKLLYQILENQEYENTIRWNDLGDKFIILDKATFIQKILPKYYRHQKYSSFLRQLNLYGFQRTCTERNNSCYYNTQFTKYNPNLQMKKKQRKQHSFNEFETSFLKNQMNQIKMSQQLLKQQIDGCLQSVDKMSSLTQYLINLLFETKIQTSNQAKSILNATLKIVQGMLPQFCLTFQELLEITFPSSEILQLENAMSYFNKNPILPQVQISIFQIFNYLSSYYPATQFSKHNEAFSNIEKTCRNLEDFACQNQQLRIQD
ncbi:unnamed protein product [Paramecium primaurelia]|uniref:HSF-type DNA-binding domain-containing protein n=1 Tax=Paramecium primaurelia TaxID=5886 RepID=A0A8S1KEG9_PARPR|nr:unnamed protein product [Paramecium primaurelia]